MGGVCTRLVNIDTNNNGTSDLEEIIALAVEVVVERALLRLDQPLSQFDQQAMVDAHTATDNKD